MNAKEMAENARRESMTYSEDSTCGYIFTPEEFCQFCEQLCREQKDIDKQAIWSRVDMEVGYIHKHNALTAIENAPMPEL